MSKCIDLHNFLAVVLSGFRLGLNWDAFHQLDFSDNNTLGPFAGGVFSPVETGGSGIRLTA